MLKSIVKKLFNLIGLEISERKSIIFNFRRVGKLSNEIISNGFKTKLSAISFCLNKQEIIFYYRDNSIGDNGVIAQMFRYQDYDFKNWVQGQKLWSLYTESDGHRQCLIIDAGANIGASTVYFLNMFPNSFLYSIEPDRVNYEILELNTRSYSNKFNFFGGISNVDGELEVVDPGLSDWGFRTNKVDMPSNKFQQVVKSISPLSILKDESVNGALPFIFKIDIEGAERELFSGDTSWMKKFPLVIIELHDGMLPFSGSSSNFLKAAASYEFDIVHKGENIFLFNRDLLKNR